jgi:tetratricopeptide (TPR) repeat protein
MHRRALAIAVSALVLVLFGVAFVRIQPAGVARVTRSGSAVSVASNRIAFAPPFGSRPCLVPLQGERLLFQRTMPVRLGGEEFDLKINFAYEPPQSLPPGWPESDWCASLAAVVAHAIPNQPLDDPRAAELRISNELQRALAALNLKTTSVSARLQLPPGWERTRPVPEVAKLAGASRPVLFIGLDGADWQLLDDYVASGAMPNLARLVHEGSSGFLETEHPPLSPIVWTTMMTGVSPLEHQILDFTHFNPATNQKEPITSYERAVPAIWNMATIGGKSAAVFGLWATYPAEPVHGLVVSDRLFTFLFTESNPPPGLVYPPAREAWARATVAAAEKSVDFAAMHRYLPWLTEAESKELANESDPYAKPGSALRRILIETEVYDRLANQYLASTIPDLTIVYIQGTDSIGHEFAPLAPPKQPGVSDADYERYHQVPELYFRRIDQFLGSMMRIAERNHAVVMLASDHGFRWKEGRPVTLSSVATATAAKWHRNEGIYLLWGLSIAPSNGHSGKGALRQVCATLLDLCALPRDAHAQQPPLTPPRPAQTVDYRKWYQPVPPPAAAPHTAAASDEELAKLKALGYIGSSESTAPRPSGVSSTKTAGAYNNAGLILKHDNRIPEAIESFQRALKIDPNLASAAWNLSDLLFSRNERIDEADELLLRALQNGLPEAPSYVIERAIKYQRSGRADRSLHLLEGAVARAGDNPELRMFRGRYRVELHDCAGALADFQAAERLRPNDAIALASAGLAQMCLGDRAGAQESFQRSLAINPNQPMLRQYLQQ